MNLIETPILVAAFFAGVLLGGIFFGGLWLTVRLTLSSAVLGLWLVGGFLLRTAIALAGVYVVSSGDWQRLIACLLGFVLGRVVITRLVRMSPLAGCVAKSGGRHAS